MVFVFLVAIFCFGFVNYLRTTPADAPLAASLALAACHAARRAGGNPNASDAAAWWFERKKRKPDKSAPAAL